MARPKASVVPLFGHKRPTPPSELIVEDANPAFVPSPELAQWARLVLIEEGGPVQNEDHRHLQDAKIGFLWTNAPNGNKGRRILGTAQPGQSTGSGWGAARSEYQIRQWFGEVPDFLIILDANYCASCEDDEFLCLVEHEIFHCGQAVDCFGMPKFRKDGKPAFAMRPHDTETFVGLAKRYGAIEEGVREIVTAVNKGPTIAQVQIDGACGTCGARRVA